jgi:hypothetical protein
MSSGTVFGTILSPFPADLIEVTRNMTSVTLPPNELSTLRVRIVELYSEGYFFQVIRHQVIEILLVQDWVLNCSISDNMSTRFQRSMTFASRKENIVIPLTLNCLSVG